MKNNKIIKKVFLVILLLLIISAIIFVIINSSLGKKEKKSNSSGVNKITQANNEKVLQENSNQDSVNQKDELKKVKIEKLDDGIKYSINDKINMPDIVIGDNYFGTQISDISMNFSQYEGKTIEIEGLYFENTPYTFVGRFSTSTVCVDCPVGYSYFEFEWSGDEKLPVTDSESWLKIIGTLKKGNDGTEYYYIDVANVEIMNEKGLETVSN